MEVPGRSPFVVRLSTYASPTGANYARPANSDSRSPVASPVAFAPSPSDFPSLGVQSHVSAAQNALGVWQLSGPIQRQGAVTPGSSPMTPGSSPTFSQEPDATEIAQAAAAWDTGSRAVTPPSRHTVPPSPSPSEDAANQLADSIDRMDFDEDDGVATSTLHIGASPFVPTNSILAPTEDAAYWRACAEHWHSVSLQLQAHITSGMAFCHPLPEPPAHDSM